MAGGLETEDCAEILSSTLWLRADFSIKTSVQLCLGERNLAAVSMDPAPLRSILSAERQGA